VKETISPFTDTGIYRFFKENTGNVEVLLKDEEVITIYFPVHPVCNFLTGETKKTFEQTVKRESNTYKILGFMRKTPQFIDEMTHLELKSHDSINITPERLGMLRDLSTLFAVMISFIVIFFYKYEKVE